MPIHPDEGFMLEFDPSLTPEQCTAALEALADFYRACSGTGFEVTVIDGDLNAEKCSPTDPHAPSAGDQ